MHPIVKEFINTDENVGSIVEKYANREQLLERVLSDLFQLGSIEKVDDQFYLDLDRAIVGGHSDTSLYLFFISIGILFTSNRSQTERSKVLYSIGSSLSEEQVHPAIRALFFQSIANLKSHEGNIVECNILIKKALNIIDKKSPRYITILGSIAGSLSSQGRLKELSEEDLGLLEADHDKDRMLNYIIAKLKNCIFTGNYSEGFILAAEHKKRFRGDAVYLIQDRVDLLKMLSGDFDKNNYQEEFFKLYANGCLALSSGDLEGSFKAFQIIQKKSWTRIPTIVFYKYFPLHIELSLKNKGKARLLLQEMNQLGEYDYLEDFFLARLQLLESNMSAAYESFSRLIKNVNRYGAMNRLLFELQFAKEMKMSDILLLSNGIKYLEDSRIALSINQEVPIYRQSEKGVKLLIGESLVISQVKKIVKKFANLKEPVLITGETGTGKELIARAIHEEGSHAKDPFIAINCGALTESLLESELFGYEAGAFTGAQKERKGIFEAAGKGTVFLDEFGDISPKMQVSLLRVLESGEIRLIGGTKTRQVECKIIIATNLDLQKAVDGKKFREDLYFRLNRFDIKLPPLRERAEDIPKLINHFLNDNKGLEGKTRILSKRLLDALVSYRWPGNIRELKNEIERLKILHPDKENLDVDHFDFTHLQSPSADFFQNTEKEEDEKKQDQSLSIKYNDITNDRILSIMNEVSTAYQRQRYIKKLFQQYKTINRVQIMKIAEISQSTASKDLDLLCKEGFIKKVTPSKSVRSHYFTIIE